MLYNSLVILTSSPNSLGSLVGFFGILDRLIVAERKDEEYFKSAVDAPIRQPDSEISPYLPLRAPDSDINLASTSI